MKGVWMKGACSTALACSMAVPAAESLLCGENEGFAIPRFVHGAAAQDDDVPHGALGGLDGAFSLLVAVLGDATDLDERAARVLGRPRALLEEAARFPEGIAAQFFSVSSGSSAAPCSERGL